MLGKTVVAALAATTTLATTSSAYFILSHPILEVTRLDPIINPGTVSSHVHTIVGGSNFQPLMDFNKSVASECTTAPVSVDKSSYWTPQLYSYSNGQYTLIPAEIVNTYYLPRTDAPPQAFPAGHRMISGDPFRRTFNASSFDDQAVSFVCLTSGDHSGDARYNQRNSFFDVPCDGMRMQVNFPTCSDGRLDSPNHKDHMTWPSNGLNGGKCPASHPIPLVQLFYEFIYPVGKFPFVPGQINYVLANGDTTGYGFHGDFISGWETVNGTNVLQEAITNCNQNYGVGGELDQCPPFVPYLDSASANACIGQNDRVNENIGDRGPISQLPGNNPLWVGNSTTKPSNPGYVENATYVAPGSTLPSGWSRVGCVAEGTSGRALTGASYVDTKGMTQATCAAFCAGKGFALAGVEYAQECYCDSKMQNGATNTTLLSSDKCSQTCTGLSTEKCGGPSTLSLMVNPALFPAPTPLPAGWAYSGCRNESSGTRALSSYSFSSSNMTIETCVNKCSSRGYSIAGVEYASECYCGSSFTGTGGAIQAESGCNMHCSGNAQENCGGPSRLSTYSTNTKLIAGKRRLN